MRLILASGSPRRAELLRAAGFTFEIVVPDVDERVRAGEAAAAYVRRLAAEKAAAASAALKGCATGTPTDDENVIVGADTAVVVDGDILGKPRDDDDAAAMLRRLSGRRHDVMTGVSLRRGIRELGRVETTAVFFAELGTRRRRVVRRERGRARQGRRVRDSGAGVALHSADRRVVFERRRAAAAGGR